MKYKNSSNWIERVAHKIYMEGYREPNHANYNEQASIIKDLILRELRDGKIGDVVDKQYQYVAGFLFSLDFNNVVLIRKNKPKWQEGLLNGVGGKKEEGEDPHSAMVREFQEETGLYVPEWSFFMEMNGDDWVVNFFWATQDNYDTVESKTSERVEICEVSKIFLREDVIQNLKWLIPMCLDKNYISGECRS